MAKTDNLTDFMTDVANAIREKKGTTDLINPQDFADEIASIEGSGGSKWTGHADAEGLRAIGWTDDDIAYFQENGVNWTKEEDEFHLVSEENKALYGVLTASNIADYADKIEYLPKLDVSGITTMADWLKNCYRLTAIPYLDTSHITSMANMCQGCANLACFPLLDTSKVTSVSYMFNNCDSLQVVPPLNLSNVTSMTYMCQNCSSLVYVSGLETPKVTSMNYAFRYCYSLKTIAGLDMSKATTAAMVSTCEVLNVALMKNLSRGISFGALNLHEKSLIYIINNATTASITITLSTEAYARLSENTEVLQALANHPNITLASA